MKMTEAHTQEMLDEYKSCKVCISGREEREERKKQEKYLKWQWQRMCQNQLVT